MPDQAYQRTIINPLEKPRSGDINQAQAQLDRSLRDTLARMFNSQNGFMRGSLQVVPQSPAALGVIIKAGIGFFNAPTDVPTMINGLVGLEDLSPYKPIVLSADYSISVPTPPASNSRIDLIEVAYQRVTDNPQSVNFLNTTSGAFAPATVPKTLDFCVDGTLAYYTAAQVPTTAFAYKSGVAGVSPVAPATDTGYMPVAYITVASGVATIVAANISDQRPIVSLGQYLGRQTLTASGTYTPTPGTTRVRAFIQAGGGGGGGAPATGASQVSLGGPGGGGELVVVDIPAGTGAIIGGAATVGAAGAAGTAGAAGGNGGNSSLVINGVTYTANGGTGGGTFGPSSTVPFVGYSGAPGSGGSNTGFARSYGGEAGSIGTGPGSASFVPTGGNGGNSKFGSGGYPFSLSGAAVGNGAGGAGVGLPQSQSAAVGAPGSAGIIYVDEYA